MLRLMSWCFQSSLNRFGQFTMGWIIVGLLRGDCSKLIRGCGHLLNLTAIFKIPMNTKMYFDKIAVIICMSMIRSVLQSQCDNLQSGLLGCAPTLIHCGNKFLCRPNSCLFFIFTSPDQGQTQCMLTPKKSLLSQAINEKSKAAISFQNFRMSESLTGVLCWLERKR